MRLQIPVKHLWRDGHRVHVDSVATFVRHLSQPFGVNWVVKPYSEITGDIGHPGIDIALPTGQDIFASHEGVVLEADDNDDRDGLGITIYDKFTRIITSYWHNSKNLVRQGEVVKKGKLIALSGGTGKAYGPHLHFGLYFTDETGQILNVDNGYHGAVDPVPFLATEVFNPTNMDRDFVSNFYLFYFGDYPSFDVLNFWEGKNYRDLFAEALSGRAGHFTANKR